MKKKLFLFIPIQVSEYHEEFIIYHTQKENGKFSCDLYLYGMHSVLV